MKEMKKYSLIAITAACLATAISAQAALIQHLIATNGSPSVLTNASGTVTNWLDISGNGNDTANAGAIVRTPKWPSTSLSASGESGVDMGTTRNGLRAWSVPAQDAWLDFTGSAAGNSGFAVLVAFKADGITGSWNPIFANHGNPATLNSFNLSTQSDGQLVFAALGTVYPRSGPKVTAGDTVVVAFNYNAATGAYEYWDSKNSSSAVGTIAANGNFSSVQVVYLGTSENGGQWLNGMIGEVKVYNNLMTTNDFTNAYQDLVARWVTPSSAILPPTVSAIGGDSSVLLNWTDNNPMGAVSNFYIYRSLDSGSNYVSIATNATTSFTDTGLINGTNYYYVLKALGTNGTLSAFSAQASATPVTIGTNAVLYQWLDASVSNSVITLFGDLLDWNDLTTNLNNGIPIVGTPLYPSTSLSGSGLPGVDFNPANTAGRAGVRLFTVPNQDPLLNFAGAAKTNGGFSALVAFKADSVDLTSLNTVLCNHGIWSIPNSFGLRFSPSGAMQAFFGGTGYTKSGTTVAGGDTVVYGVTYDAQTGVVNFWDSKNNSTALFTNAPFFDLSSEQTMKLGTSDNPAQWFNGMIGEVKIYQGKLDSAALVAEGQSLATKWGAVVAQTNDFYLSNLVLSSGTLSPAFGSNVLSYAASVANSVSNLTVTPTAVSANSVISVRVNGGGYANVTSGSPSGLLALNEGANTVDVQVTAQNPAFTQTYTVTVTRAAGAPAPEPIMTTVSGGSLILSWTDPSWKLATGDECDGHHEHRFGGDQSLHKQPRQRAATLLPVGLSVSG